MKKAIPSLLKQYVKMSGDKKVRIAMDWSQLVREVYREGQRETQLKTHARNRSKTTS